MGHSAWAAVRAAIVETPDPPSSHTCHAFYTVLNPEQSRGDRYTLSPYPPRNLGNPLCTGVATINSSWRRKRWGERSDRQAGDHLLYRNTNECTTNFSGGVGSETEQYSTKHRRPEERDPLHSIGRTTQTHPARASSLLHRPATRTISQLPARMPLKIPATPPRQSRKDRARLTKEEPHISYPAISAIQVNMCDLISLPHLCFLVLALDDVVGDGQERPRLLAVGFQRLVRFVHEPVRVAVRSIRRRRQRGGACGGIQAVGGGG